MLSNHLLAAFTANDMAGLIVTGGIFIVVIALIIAGALLLKSGNGKDKAGIDMVFIKLNIETGAGGFCIAAALLLMLNFINRFYGK